MSTHARTALPASRLMLHALAQNWWWFLLRGVVALVFGVLAFVWPGITLLTVVLFYGAFALADGVFAIIAAVRGKGAMPPRWWLWIVGLLGIFAGLGTFFWPGITALALVIVIGAWALVRGIFEIIGAIRLRKEIDNEWLLILNGALSALFGVVLLMRPDAGALALIWLIGAFAIVSGILLIGLSIRLKGQAHATT